MLNACDEGLPFRTQTPAAGGATIAFEKNARTGLPVLKIPARPMHVRHDISRRDVVSLGQVSSQARCSIDGCSLPATVSKFANLDTDALAVAPAAIVGVIALFGWEQVFDGFPVINAKVPNHPSGPPEARVVPTSLAFDD
jgi:hypothetical protein